jgi:hypothetical protein
MNGIAQNSIDDDVFLIAISQSSICWTSKFELSVANQMRYYALQGSASNSACVAGLEVQQRDPTLERSADLSDAYPASSVDFWQA